MPPASPPAANWHVGAADQSCTTVCEAEGKVCDATHMRGRKGEVDSASEVRDLIVALNPSLIIFDGSGRKMTNLSIPRAVLDSYQDTAGYQDTDWYPAFDEPACNNDCLGCDAPDCSYSYGEHHGNTSLQYQFNGVCEDGGPGNEAEICDYGTDCADCGLRPVNNAYSHVRYAGPNHAWTPICDSTPPIGSRVRRICWCSVPSAGPEDSPGTSPGAALEARLFLDASGGAIPWLVSALCIGLLLLVASCTALCGMRHGGKPSLLRTSATISIVCALLLLAALVPIAQSLWWQRMRSADAQTTEPWLWAFVLPSTPYSYACAEVLFASLGSDGTMSFLSICIGVVIVSVIVTIASGRSAGSAARRADVDSIDVAVGDEAGGNRKSSLTTIALNIRNTILTGGKPPPPRPKSESEPTEGSTRAPTKLRTVKRTVTTKYLSTMGWRSPEVKKSNG